MTGVHDNRNTFTIPKALLLIIFATTNSFPQEIYIKPSWSIILAMLGKSGKSTNVLLMVKLGAEPMCTES